MSVGPVRRKTRAAGLQAKHALTLQRREQLREPGGIRARDDHQPSAAGQSDRHRRAVGMLRA
jgi:hypothetical protein